jgi:hypothetical protein
MKSHFHYLLSELFYLRIYIYIYTIFMITIIKLGRGRGRGRGGEEEGEVDGWGGEPQKPRLITYTHYFPS